MIAYQALILAMLIFMGTIAAINIVSVPSIRLRGAAKRWPPVSILIPARDEERSLGLLLSTLAEQDYPTFEVIVLDDCSIDSTGRIADEWAKRDARFHVVTGVALPKGWVGKNFACHQLSCAARGEILLFVDADTLHRRSSVREAVTELLFREAGLLSIFPEQIMKTPSEKLILPLLYYIGFCFLPTPLIRLSKRPALAMANGQFMMFTRPVYDAIGGHAAVRGALVEDVWLARNVKRRGFRVSVLDGGSVVSCRMYRSFTEIWNGFSKNIFAGAEFSTPFLLGMLMFFLATSVAPWAFMIVGIAQGLTHTAWFSCVIVQVIALLVTRLMLAARFKTGVVSSLFHPLGMATLVAIGVNSLRWMVVGGGSRWKGRHYRMDDLAAAGRRDGR